MPDATAPARVVSVSRDDQHRFTKPPVQEIRLVADWGVEGDAHAGATVQHRYRGGRVAEAPNLRQVHLLHAELFDDVAERGYRVEPGDMGENITTEGVDLLRLPTDALLRLGPDAVVRLTGLRTPCRQIDRFARGLMKEMVARHPDGRIERRAGVMAVVVEGGVVRAGDAVVVELPAGPHLPLGPV